LSLLKIVLRRKSYSSGGDISLWAQVLPKQRQEYISYLTFGQIGIFLSLSDCQFILIQFQTR
jgi:hypothetical protein